MGTWGPGLYSGDIASDLRTMIGAVLKLPFDDEQVVDVLCDREPQVANDTTNEDHTVFWLVLADQFEKRGVASARVREKAIAIIDNDTDLAMLEKLGLKGADLRKRARALAALRARLVAAPTESRPRVTLKAPQAYVLELGTLYACPTKGSAAINPSRGRSNFDGSPWIPDGFRQFIILDRGRAFDYLAWYQPIVTIATVTRAPSLKDARSDLWWQIETPKTCSPKHFKTMEIQAIGAVPIDFDKARARFPRGKRGTCFLGWGGTGAAINDVSISDTMWPSSHDWADLIARGTLPAEGPTVMKSLSDILIDGS
jgi:hypothetical protein